MKKTTMKLVFFVLSFVAFATTPVFSQSYVSKDQAVQMLTKYVADSQAKSRPTTDPTQTDRLVMMRQVWGNQLLIKMKEGMTVGEAFTDVKNRFSSVQPAHGERYTIVQAVQNELEEMLTN
jgi:hypothetical protein